MVITMDKNTYDFIVQNLEVLKKDPREIKNIDIMDKAIWYTESLMSTIDYIKISNLDPVGYYTNMIVDLATNIDVEISDANINKYRYAIDLGLQCFIEGNKNGFN